jgi:hypothetical protein
VVPAAHAAGVLPALLGLHGLLEKERKTIMTLLMPDAGKIVYLIIGVVVAKKLLPKLGG